MLIRHPSTHQDKMADADAAAQAPDLQKKHPLENKWTLWFDNPQTKQTMNKYGQTLRSVFTFDNVEDFWW